MIDYGDLDNQCTNAFIVWLSTSHNAKWEFQRQGQMRCALVCVEAKDISMIGTTAVMEFTSPAGVKTVKLDALLVDQYTGKYSGPYNERTMINIAEFFDGIATAEGDNVFVNNILCPFACVTEGQWFINPILHNYYNNAMLEKANSVEAELVTYSVSYLYHLDREKPMQAFCDVLTVAAIKDNDDKKKIEQMLIEKYGLGGTLRITGISRL